MLWMITRVVDDSTCCGHFYMLWMFLHVGDISTFCGQSTSCPGVEGGKLGNDLS